MEGAVEQMHAKLQDACRGQWCKRIAGRWLLLQQLTVGVEIPPKVMRILARVSKMILVCIGQKTEKKESELVTSATALVFGVLDTLVVRYLLRN